MGILVIFYVDEIILIFSPKNHEAACLLGDVAAPGGTLRASAPWAKRSGAFEDSHPFETAKRA